MVVPFHLSDFLTASVDELQTKADVLVRLWLLLAEELRGHFGSEGLSESLGRILVADDQSRRDHFKQELDELINQGERAKAARLIREWAGVTWDQAHDLSARWREIPKDRKQTWMRFMQIKRALDQISNVAK